jgi:adenosylcobinamide-GDP ribazoletransferase
MWALIAAHGGARATMVAFMFLVPPARSDGLSYNAGRPPGDSAAAAAAIGFLILTICLGPARGILALIFLLAVIAAMAWLSARQIEGQTGDTLGAVEQVAEILILLVALG